MRHSRSEEWRPWEAEFLVSLNPCIWRTVRSHNVPSVSFTYAMMNIALAIPRATALPLIVLVACSTQRQRVSLTSTRH
jgi:hypothetical protein